MMQLIRVSFIVLKIVIASGIVIIALTVSAVTLIEWIAQPHWRAPGVVTTLAGKPYGSQLERTRCVPKDGAKRRLFFAEPEAWHLMQGPEIFTSPTLKKFAPSRVMARSPLWRVGSTADNMRTRADRSMAIERPPRSAHQVQSRWTMQPQALDVADQYGIRRIDKAGVMTTIVRDVRATVACGSSRHDEYRYAFCGLTSIAFDPTDRSLWVTYSGAILRSDTLGHPIVVASRVRDLENAGCEPIDGVGAGTVICNPMGIARNPVDGKMYFSDGPFIRSVDKDGRVQAFAGIEYPPTLEGITDTAGLECRDWDLVRRISAFCSPRQIAFDDSNNMYVSDSMNEQIRRIDKNGLVSSVAGHFYTWGTFGSIACFGIDGTGMGAKFCGPSGLVIDVAPIVCS